MTDANRDERPERPIESDGTTLLFKALGKQIKTLRETAGMSQKDLGKAAFVGPDLVSAMERGVRTQQPEFLARADKLLDGRGVLTAVIEDVKEALAKARTRHPDWFKDFARAEAESVSVCDYSNHVIPGLLQTEDYARYVYSQRRPFLDEETIEKRVADRMARQEIFSRWPVPTFSFVLEEVVLHRPIGGPAVHQEQLRKLLEIGSMRSVSLQVMPTDREEHPSLDGSFIMLSPKGRSQVAYTEIYGHPHLVTDPEEVRVFSERYGTIRTEALTTSLSLSLIKELLGRQ